MVLPRLSKTAQENADILYFFVEVDKIIRYARTNWNEDGWTVIYVNYREE